VLSNVFLKSLRDERRALALWGMGTALLIAMMVAFYPSIKDNEQIEELAEAYPENLMALMGIGDLTDIASGAGYLSAELFGFMGPLLFIIYAVRLGSGAVAGEEGRGTLEVLLSEPITRGRLVVQKAAAVVSATVLLAVAYWAVLAIGAAGAGMDVGPLRLAEATFSLLLLGLAFGALALAVGCVAGGWGTSVGVASAVALGTHLLNALGGMVDYMEPARWLSPFYYYSGADPLRNGLHLGHAAVLLVAIGVLLMVAYFGLRRRDLQL
jgi:ABC-2 type transport system permease protein